jgi:predicted  nucleic acid-binding Zn-ribbon protein
MSLANVNIGIAANDGTGDPLRSAFRTINQNFANLAPFTSNANLVYNPGVVSVAGRAGNVVLSVSDVTGAASIGYVNAIAANISIVAANIAGNLNTVTWANVTGKPSFANIATTGSWNDLSNIPLNVANAVTQTSINTAVNSINANNAAANTRIGQVQANVNTLTSNAASQSLELNALRANITAANAAIAAISFNSVNANVTAVNAAITALTLANVNQGSYIEQNTNRVAAANIEIGKLRANITAANTAIADLISELSGAFGDVGNIIIAGNANVDAANAAITALSLSTTANAIAQDSLIGSLTANAATQHNEINSLRANVTAANAAIGIINANIGSFQIFSNANAVTQRTQIVNLQEDLNLANLRIANLVLANTVQDSIMQTITANVGNLWVWVDEIDNEAFLLGTVFDQLVLANIAVEANIANLQSNTAELASNISILYANAAIQDGQFLLVNSNVTSQISRIDDLYSNIALRIAEINTLTSNAVTQHNSLTSLTSNAATQSVAIASLDANVGAMASNIGTFQSNLATLYILNGEHGDEIDLLYDRVANVEIIASNVVLGLDLANAAIIATEGNLNILIESLDYNAAAQATQINSAESDISSLFGIASTYDNTFGIINANIGAYQNYANANTGAYQTYSNSTVSALTVNVQVLESNVSFTQIDITNLQAKFDNGNLIYTPNNAAHWNGTISNVAAALDELASRIWAIENP